MILEATINDSGGTPTGMVTFDDPAQRILGERAGKRLRAWPRSRSRIWQRWAPSDHLNLRVAMAPLAVYDFAGVRYDDRSSEHHDDRRWPRPTRNAYWPEHCPADRSRLRPVGTRLGTFAVRLGHVFRQCGVELAQVGSNAGGAAIIHDFIQLVLRQSSDHQPITAATPTSKASNSPIFNQDVLPRRQQVTTVTLQPYPDNRRAERHLHVGWGVRFPPRGHADRLGHAFSIMRNLGSRIRNALQAALSRWFTSHLRACGENAIRSLACAGGELEFRHEQVCVY